MVIEDKRLKAVAFEDLRVGDVFQYEDSLFMKVKEISYSTLIGTEYNFNAILLGDYSLRDMSKNLVSRVRAKLVIE